MNTEKFVLNTDGMMAPAEAAMCESAVGNQHLRMSGHAANVLRALEDTPLRFSLVSSQPRGMRVRRGQAA